MNVVHDHERFLSVPILTNESVIKRFGRIHSINRTIIVIIIDYSQIKKNKKTKSLPTLPPVYYQTAGMFLSLIR
jgi:hypothetical protein